MGQILKSEILSSTIDFHAPHVSGKQEGMRPEKIMEVQAEQHGFMETSISGWLHNKEAQSYEKSVLWMSSKFCLILKEWQFS